MFFWFGKSTRSVVVTSSFDNDKFSAPKIDCNTVRAKKIDSPQCAHPYDIFAFCVMQNVILITKSGECEPKLSFDYSKLMIILTTYYIAINLAQLMDVNAKCTFFLDTTVCVCVLLFNLRISIVWDALFFRDLKNFVKRKLPNRFLSFLWKFDDEICF